MTLNDLLQHKQEITELFDPHDYFAQRKQIAIIWSVEDVQSVRPDLNEDQAWQVLEYCNRYHDCCHGINWETLEYAAIDLFDESTSTAEQ